MRDAGGDEERHAEELAQRLDSQRAWLGRFVELEGRGLLKRESAEDLVGAIHLKALEQAAGFRYEGDEGLRGWLRRIGRQVLADRHDYWSAARRRATRMLRITSRETVSGMQAPGRMTGPFTVAARRELVEAAARAMLLLLPRDQEVVKMVTAGQNVKEVAAALGVSEAAAEQARHRAMQRFGKLVDLLVRGEPGGRGGG